LATAAAVTMLLALLLAWNPSELPKYATLGSAVLSLAATLHSINMDNLITGLAFLSLASPIYIVTIPTIRWPERGADWMALFGMSWFISIASVSAILGVPALTDISIDIAIDIGATSSIDVIILLALTGPAFCMLIIVLRLILPIIAHTTNNPRSLILEFYAVHIRHLLRRNEPRSYRRQRGREQKRRR